MPFKDAPRNYDFPSAEKRIIEFWKSRDIFRKSVALREGSPRYVFYEGPPTANGRPHPGHVLTRVIKDLMPRYRTMCGYQVRRKAGWDTHGLPVEIEVEKELGIESKDGIEAYGVEKFVRKCMDSVFRYTRDWQELTDRIGFWIDLDHAYVTYTTDYVESVWWALSEIHRKGLLYQGHKVVPWCPRCGTALSSHEVGWGYKTVTDPSIMIRFKVQGEVETYLIAWTTTPWTLISNVALAIDAGAEYAWVEAEREGAPGTKETLILAKALLQQVMGERPHRVLRTAKGASLVGMKYEPLYRFAEPKEGKAWEVVPVGFVEMDTGTGIVHTAPAFGADDYEAAKSNGLAFIQLVGADGRFSAAVKPWGGKFVKDADESIIHDLESRGLLYSRGKLKHEYPHCWRCSSPLIYYARGGWFIRTTAHKARMLELNEKIRWHPEHIRSGRFGNFLADNIDWALSRERYWGTPLPVWICRECGAQRVVSSKAEIEKLKPGAFAFFEDMRRKDAKLSEHLAVHKPFIDRVELPCPKCGKADSMRRVPEVIDCWFDSGAMPFAQWGYPRAGKEDFRREFPCDFISEAIDQTRGWFYSLLAISTMLFDREPYRHCIVLGLVCDEKGEKMSKSKGNYLDPNKILATKGADAMRWYFYSANQPWTSVRFYEDAITGAQRDFLLKLYNVYLFFVIYARIDGFDPSKDLASFPGLPGKIERAKGYRPVRDRALLDRWILAELDSTVRASRAALDAYDIYAAAGRISDLVESASNWYLRRSRNRFWRSGSDTDKLDAYWTLYEILVETSKLLAPFTPFIAEEMWGNLVAGLWKDAPESVHLADYPLPQDSRVDEQLTSSMALAREIVQLGRAARTAGKLRVRQPLSRLIVVLADPSRAAEVAEISGIIIDELNVKRLSFADTPGDYVSHELRPNYRALGPRFGAGVKAVAEALSKLETEPTRLRLLREGAITVAVNGKDERLSQEEIDVRVSALPHYTAAESPRCVVVLETDLTDALVLEGHARELVHHVQSMRKELDLDYQDRITVAASAEGEGAKLLKRVVDGHGAYLRSETLAVFIGAFQGAPSGPAGALTKPVSLGGLEVTVSIGKSGGKRP